MSEAAAKKQKMSGETSTSRLIFSTTTQNFAEVKQYPGFVDHTELIKLFFGDSPKKLFITAPANFGKSTNLSMLRRFFGMKPDGTVEPRVNDRQNFHVFEDTKIMNIDTEEHREALTKHFCAHPVVHVDFGIGALHTYRGALLHILSKTFNAYWCHERFLKANLKDSDKEDFQDKWRVIKKFKHTLMPDDYERLKTFLKDGLKTLCGYLYKASGGKRVLILVDRADALLTATFINNSDREEIQKIAGLMEELYETTTKGDDIDRQVQGVVLTGISYLKGIGYSNKLEIESHRFLDDGGDDGYRHTTAQMYGLTRPQLEDLLEKLQRDGLLQWDTPENIREKIDDNYDGYCTSSGEIRLYSLWSVLYFLRSQKTSVTHAEIVPLARYYRKAFKSTLVGENVIQLLAGEDVEIGDVKEVNIDQLVDLRDVGEENVINRNIMFSLLMEVGFLTYSEQGMAKDGDRSRVRIPNKEVKTVFNDMIFGNEIQLGKFDLALQKECGKEIAKLSNTSYYNDENSFKQCLKCLHEKLTELCQQFNPYFLSECHLQVLIMMIMQRSFFGEVVPKFYSKEHHGHVWARSEHLECTCIWELKVNKEQAENKTSMWAMKEIHADKGSRNVEAIKKTDHFLLLGLSVNEERKPSICIQTKGKEKGIFVSETEHNVKNFDRHYQGWYDLLKENYVGPALVTIETGDSKKLN